MKRRILVITIGIWPPAIKMTGMAAVYNLLKILARNSPLEIHILTAWPSWAEGDKTSWIKKQETQFNLKIHTVSADNLLLTRLLFFLNSIKLQRRFNFELIHEYSATPALVGLTGILGRIYGVKTIHTLCAINENFSGAKSLGFGSSLTDIVIITSRQLTLKNKMHYLPLGVDAEKFSPRPKVSKSSERTVLFLGSLERRKGAFILMKALGKVIKYHPDARFILASYGEEVRDPRYLENKRKLQEFGADLERKIKFLEGMQNVPNLLARADIFVLPAISLHGTLAPPLTLVEAMSAGKACVVSDICRGDGLVEDKVNCLLFSSGEADDLAAKINLLLENKALREKLARNARQKVVKQFEINKIAKRMLNIYEETLR